MATEIAAGRAAELHRIVELACARIGLDASGAELIKYTVNAVYRLPREQVVVRVASDRSGVSRGQRVVTVARWLQTRGAPIATLLDGDQPLSVDGYTVTFWRELTRRTDWSAADLATPLHHLHTLELDSDDHTALPRDENLVNEIGKRRETVPLPQGPLVVQFEAADGPWKARLKRV